MQDRTLTEELKFQFKHGGMHIRLIFVNALVFLFHVLLSFIGNGTHSSGIVETIQTWLFSLNTNIKEFIFAPWGLFTSIFSHFSFLHLLFNMIFLYFIGNMFRQFFSDRRLLHVYIWGGIFGGLFEIAARQFLDQSIVVVGASGSVMALFIAMAFYKPNLQVQLFGIFPIKLYVIALIYLVSDFMQIMKNDGIAHFAHLGGAFLGFLSVQQLHSSSNFINWSETKTQQLKSWFAGLKSGRPKMKVEKGGRVYKTDEQYNMESKEKQEKINKILDKISKSGYESLSKAEKEFLFSQSKK